MKHEPTPIEVLLAHSDGTWTTAIFSVPHEVVVGKSRGNSKWNSAVLKWCQDKVKTDKRYRHITYCSIYNIDPEEVGSDW